MEELTLSEKQLRKMPKRKLIELCQEAQIELPEKDMDKDDIIEEIISQGEEELEGTVEEVEEKKKEENNINNTKFSDSGDEEFFNMVDENDFKDKSILYKIIAPASTVRLVRRRLLNEKFDRVKKQYVRIDEKTPMVSKSLADVFEGQILSFFNPQGFISSYDDEEYRIMARINLLDFNDLLLNSRGIKEEHYNIIFDMFRNLLVIALKISFDGEFRKFMMKLNGKYDGELDNEKKEDKKSPSVWDEFTGMMT